MNHAARRARAHHAQHKDQAVVMALMDAGADLPDVADKHFSDSSKGQPLAAMARWSSSAHIRQTIADLRRLASERADLNLARSRTVAIERLLDLAGGGEGGELARKSCVDLLRAPRPEPTVEVTPKSPAGLSNTEPLSKSQADRVRSMLEKLGSQTEPRPESNGRARASTSERKS